MPCINAKTMRFRVYEKGSNGEAYDTGKEISCTLEASNKYMEYIKGLPSNCIVRDYILLEVFKLYGFDLFSGHILSWVAGKEYIEGKISWKGTAWEIRRIS
jgi:hypothetical protein